VFALGDAHIPLVLPELCIARVTPLRHAFGAPPPLPGEDL
jgi:hypothetical protein